MSYLCRNGHRVKHSWQADSVCSKCKSNEKRRKKVATPSTDASAGEGVKS